MSPKSKRGGVRKGAGRPQGTAIYTERIPAMRITTEQLIKLERHPGETLADKVRGLIDQQGKTK